MICSLIYGGKVTHTFHNDQIVGRKKQYMSIKGKNGQE